jgi:hypothetical protein
MEYEKEEQLLNLTVKKFVLGPGNFAQSLVNPNNVCFVTKSDDVNNDFSGFVDVSSCVNNLPLAFSQPHFYQGSEKLVNQFENLSPNKSLHETFVMIEPSIGFALNARKALQLNIDLDAVLKTEVFSKLSPTMFPILWFDLGGSIDQKIADDLNQQLYRRTQTISDYISAASIGSCFVTSLFFILILLAVSDPCFEYANHLSNFSFFLCSIL